MIDERINRTLTELESSLLKVKSAQKQVEETINSFNGLKSITASYVSSLAQVNDNIKNLANIVNQSLVQKVETLDQEKELIVESCKSSIASVERATEDVKTSVCTSISTFETSLKTTTDLCKASNTAVEKAKEAILSVISQDLNDTKLQLQQIADSESSIGRKLSELSKKIAFLKSIVMTQLAISIISIISIVAFIVLK